MTSGDERATVRHARLPGAEGLWVFLGADAVVFALLFLLFSQARHADPALFGVGRERLDADLAGLDTMLLLTSSWLVALAMRALARDDLDRAPPLLLGGLVAGGLFVVSKVVEYGTMVGAGRTPITDPFFMWYFVLTGIHLLHVLAGLVALTVVWRGAGTRRYASESRMVPECVASFWHLVDLLWIMIFPLLYLQR